MAESNLALAYADYYGEAAWMLGFGRATPPLSVSGKHAHVETMLDAGLRQFYFPPALPGQASPYEWYFLHPIATLATIANTRTYNLPADFGSIASDFYYAAGASVGQRRILLVPENRIRAMRAGATLADGQPQFASISAIP